MEEETFDSAKTAGNISDQSLAEIILIVINHLILFLCKQEDDIYQLHLHKWGPETNSSRWEVGRYDRWYF